CRTGPPPALPGRGVVPAVLIGGSGRRGQDAGRRGRVVLQREGDRRAGVPSLVGTDAASRSASVVGAAVGDRCAGGDPRGCVRAAPTDPDGVVVTAVLIGSPGCSG